jgi:hypothetical protein
MLDAVEAAAVAVEDDPAVDSVGTGGLLLSLLFLLPSPSLSSFCIAAVVAAISVSAAGCGCLFLGS